MVTEPHDDTADMDWPATATVLRAAGRGEEARALLRRAIAHTPSALLRAELGLDLLGGGALREAAAVLGAVLTEAPHDPALLHLPRLLGRALFDAGLWEEAHPWLARAAALEPWDAPLRAAAARAAPRAYLQPTAFDPNLGRTLRRYSPRESAHYVYAIDVVGTCNLRCPTCPVGNSPDRARPRGTMPVDLFGRILAKLRAECPDPAPEIWMFNWGEPLLHPNLPELIGLVRAAGLSAHLSTNLNIRRGLEAVLAAGPATLKVSLSGISPETYGRTHVGGSIALVRENLRHLRAILDRTKAGTRIWVSHHLYRHNGHETTELARLCAELGFAYAPIPAFYMPLERLAEVLDGKDNPHDRGIVAALPIAPGERQAMIAAQRGGGGDCELRFNQTAINHDGSVALCCAVYDQDNMLGVGFLDEDFAALERRKYAHPFCGDCIRRNLHFTRPELDPATVAAGPTGMA